MTMTDERMFRIEQCRSCNQSIIWARSTGGRAMPVDADPSPEGTVLLGNIQGHARARVVAGSVLASARERGLRLRTSHFATCPDAGEWRKK